MKLMRFSPILLALMAMACLPTIGKADLVVVGPVTNGTYTFLAHLVWLAPSPLDSISNIGGFATPWSVSAVATNLGNFEVTTAQHEIAPHAGEPAPGPSLVAYFGGIGPGTNGGTIVDSKAHGSHSDVLRVTLSRHDAVSSDVYISVNHVPEPTAAAVWMFGAGSLFVAARKRRG